MAPLRIALAALTLVVAMPANAEPVRRWQPYIEEASARFGIPVEWIERVMRAESGGQTTWNGRPIISHAGAMGLMQLMPGTWAEMRAQLGLGRDPHEPRDNILAGTAYLRLMYDRFGYPGLFAAYNAGPGRYAEHRATGRPLPGETRAYLANVAGREQPVAKRAEVLGQRVDAIFFLGGPAPMMRANTNASPSALFVELTNTETRAERP